MIYYNTFSPNVNKNFLMYVFTLFSALYNNQSPAIIITAGDHTARLVMCHTPNVISGFSWKALSFCP